MNTYKTALRILKSRKMYLVIYLGFIGIMMFAISWQIMHGSMTGGDEVFHPDTARVAVVDAMAMPMVFHPRCVPILRWMARWWTLPTIPKRCSRPSLRTMSI